VRRLLALAAFLALAASAAAAAPLHRVQCVGAAKGCTRGYAVAAPTGVVVSRDGRNVYVRNGVGSRGSLGVFTRNGASGRLTQVECVARRARPCVDGRGLETPAALALSPDGKSLYAAARNGRSVGIYRRIAHGNLRAAGSVTGIAHPSALAVSPDGRFVYAGGDRLWIYARAASGGLKLAATVAEPATALALSGDGATLYAGSGGGAHGTVVAFARDATSGGLTESARVDAPATPGIQQPAQIVVARGSVYVVSTVSGAVARFDRALRPTGLARGLPRAFGLAVSDRVWVAYRDGVASFSLALVRGPRAALKGATGVAAYGRFAYATSPGGVTVLRR
jgi:6-phosphogluconolactonase (cycloisomerase 2 family)